MPDQIELARKAFRLKEIAERNGLGLTTIYNEIKKGRLRVRKVGRATIVTAADEAAWLNALATGPSSHSGGAL
jgi:hypothetical protein